MPGHLQIPLNWLGYALNDRQFRVAQIVDDGQTSCRHGNFGSCWCKQHFKHYGMRIHYVFMVKTGYLLLRVWSFRSRVTSSVADVCRRQIFFIKVTSTKTSRAFCPNISAYYQTPFVCRTDEFVCKSRLAFPLYRGSSTSDLENPEAPDLGGFFGKTERPSSGQRLCISLPNYCLTMYMTT